MLIVWATWREESHENHDVIVVESEASRNILYKFLFTYIFCGGQRNQNRKLKVAGRLLLSKEEGG